MQWPSSDGGAAEVVRSALEAKEIWRSKEIRADAWQILVEESLRSRLHGYFCDSSPVKDRFRTAGRQLITAQRALAALQVSVAHVSAQARQREPGHAQKSFFAETAMREFHLEDFWQNYKSRPGTSWASTPVVSCEGSLVHKKATATPELFGSWTSSPYGLMPKPSTAPAHLQRSETLETCLSPRWVEPSMRSLIGSDSAQTWEDFPGLFAQSGDLDLENFSSDCFSYCTSVREVGNSPMVLADSSLWEQIPPDELPVLDPPLEQYLHSCCKLGVRPRPLPFITGHSPNLLAAEQNLTDPDLLSMLSLAKEVDLVEDVNLSCNPKLTGKALVPFLQECAEKRTCLCNLNLSNCRSMGKSGVTMLTSLLPRGLGLLTSLEISGVVVPLDLLQPFMDSLGQHPNLQKLGLANLAMGRLGRSAKAGLHALFQNRCLEEVDLAWNTFDTAAFTQLGKCLANSSNLKRLSVAGCSNSSRLVRDLPIEHFLEQLLHAQKLSYLDISVNHIDSRGACILEDVCEHLRPLRSLVMSENPLGMQGQRYIFRLLAQKTSGLDWMKWDGCGHGSALAEKELRFCPRFPSDVYDLDLARPFHRAVLRRLYKTCERFRVKNALKSCPPLEVTKKQGLWILPQGGTFSVTLNVDFQGSEAIERCPSFQALQQHYAENRRVRPAVHKVAPLLALLFQATRSSKEQETMLECLCMDFTLNLAQVRALCYANTSSAFFANQMALAACCLPEPKRLLLEARSLEDYVSKTHVLADFFNLNLEAPNWRYHLDLSSRIDGFIAESLFLLNAWDIVVDKRSQRMDLSEFGDYSHWRNVLHEKAPWRLELTRWTPLHGQLDFDYVSAKRPDAKATIDPATFQKILRLLGRLKEVEPMAKVVCLKSCAHRLMLTSLQLRQLLCLFKGEARLRLAILLYFQVLDIQNEKIFRVLFEAQDLQRLRKALGYLASWPFLQPEGNFELQLEQREKRVIANQLALLKSQEKGEFEDLVFRDKTGRIHAMGGIPKSWESLEKITSRGSLSGRYLCSHEERNLQWRKHQLQQCGWKTGHITKQNVIWWGGDAPHVTEFLHCILRRFSSVRKGFEALAGKDGKLSRGDFQQVLVELDYCDEGLYSFLACGQKVISRKEWSLLEDFNREIQQEVEGLAAHLLDAEELPERFTEEALVQVLEEQGFYGPTKGVLRSLEKDALGEISLEDLKRFLAGGEGRRVRGSDARASL